MVINKLFVISPDILLAHRYAGVYLNVTSNDIEVFRDVDSINDVDDYRVFTMTPYIQNGAGELVKAALDNKNIELVYFDQIEFIGKLIANTVRETFDALNLQSYPASVLKNFIQERIQDHLGTKFPFDFNFNVRNGNIEMVPLNQPTAAYLIISRHCMRG